MPKTAIPQAVIADLKIRSGISPPEAVNRGADCAVTGVTFMPSTGCGPGISGRVNAGLAIAINLAETCYKSVKIKYLFQFASSINLRPRHRLKTSDKLQRGMTVLQSSVSFVWQ
jgi:hypothetical protein